MDESIKAQSMNDIFVQNFYPDSDAIHVSDKNDKWGVTIFRDEDGEVSVIVVENTEHTRMDLTLGADGYTQKC